MEFLFLCKHETVQYERESNPWKRCLLHLYSSTILYVVYTKALNKAKVMYVYEKTNCMISFQYILLYILVMLISPIVYKGCSLYSLQLVLHTIEGRKKLEGKRNQEQNICELQLCQR